MNDFNNPTDTFIAAMMIGGSKVSTGAVTIAAFLLRPCSSFQVPNALETGSRGRFGAATTFLSSSVTEEPSSEISLDSEAIQLKDDLITLAAATRRGVSGLTGTFFCTLYALQINNSYH